MNLPAQRRTGRIETAPHIKVMLKLVRDFCLGIVRWIEEYYQI